MNLRAMKAEDMIQLKMIHHKYYRDEFMFPDFQNKFFNAFVIEDEGEIITGGGVRAIAEAVALTDKNYNKRARKEALSQLLSACAFTANLEKFDEIHAFIQDPNWREVLVNRGFHATKGDALVFQLGEVN